MATAGTELELLVTKSLGYPKTPVTILPLFVFIFVYTWKWLNKKQKTKNKAKIKINNKKVNLVNWEKIQVDK